MSDALATADKPRRKERKRALLIGICLSDPNAPLSGPHKDVDNVAKLLVSKRGFRYADIVIMKDDPSIPYKFQPTRENILEQMRALVQGPFYPDDSRFLYYSGHGGQVKDEDGDEADGLDECICPIDDPIPTAESSISDSHVEPPVPDLQPPPAVPQPQLPVFDLGPPVPDLHLPSTEAPPKLPIYEKYTSNWTILSTFKSTTPTSKPSTTSAPTSQSAASPSHSRMTSSSSLVPASPSTMSTTSTTSTSATSFASPTLTHSRIPSSVSIPAVNTKHKAPVLITDDTLYQTVIKPLPADAHLLALFDTCHSGSILDLPYEYSVTTGHPKHRGTRHRVTEVLQHWKQDVEHSLAAKSSASLLRPNDLTPSDEKTPRESAPPTPASSRFRMLAHRVLEEAERSVSPKEDSERGMTDSFFEQSDLLKVKGGYMLDHVSQLIKSRSSRGEEYKGEVAEGAGAASSWATLHEKMKGAGKHLAGVRNQARARETPANVFLISGCKDAQTAAEVGKKDSKEPKSGLVTKEFLKVLEDDTIADNLTFFDFMNLLRKRCGEDYNEQLVQLSTGHEIELRTTPFTL